MEFTIYTFGDVEIFRAALTGVAMIFSADGFFVHEGGIGLGALTGLGLLIGLIAILVNGIITQKIELGGFIVMVIVFSILFVPKFSVNVEDYNGDAIAKVDSVPLGIALPAGIISGLARELNIKMGTAFSTVEGYPAGLMTPEALSSPLKMLLSLRNGYQVIPERNPVLVSNMASLVAYCLAGRETTAPQFQTIKIKDAPIVTLLQMAEYVGGLTMYTDPSTKTTSLVSCPYAAGEILESLDAFMESGNLTEVLTAVAARNRAAPVRITASAAGGPSVPEVQPVTPEMSADNLNLLFQVNAKAAYDFMQTALFMPYVSRAYTCGSASGDPVQWAQCMPFQSAALQWEEDAAASGSFFQRLMFHGMNALFFMWICLSPVVAVMMLMMGVKGLKLAGSYLMFGAWTVSWYIGASIVNFYMLKQLQYELSMLGKFENLTPVTIGYFFDALSTKFAMGGDMMASVPLIMMTIMTGSLYGMVSLANRWGGKDYYDEKVNSPSAIQGAPLYAMQTPKTMMHAGVFRDQRYSEGMSFDSSVAAQSARMTAVRSEHQAARSFERGLSETFQTANNKGKLSELLTQTADKLEANNQHTEAQVFRQAAGASHGTKQTETEVEKLAKNLSAKFTVSPSKGMAGAGGEAGIGKMNQQGETLETSSGDSKSRESTRGRDSSVGTKESIDWSRVQKVANTVGTVNSTLTGTTYNDSLKEVDTYVATAQDSTEISRRFGGAETRTSTQMAADIASSPAVQNHLDSTMEFFEQNRKLPESIVFMREYEAGLRSYKNLEGDELKRVAQAHALRMVATNDIAQHKAGEGTARYTAFNDILYGAGDNGVRPVDSEVAAQTNSGLNALANDETGKARALVPEGNIARGAAPVATVPTSRETAKHRAEKQASLWTSRLTGQKKVDDSAVAKWTAPTKVPGQN